MEKLASNYKSLEKRLSGSEPLAQLLTEKRQLDGELESHFQAFSSNHTSTVLLSAIRQEVSVLHKAVLKIVIQDSRGTVNGLFQKFSSALWENVESFHKENCTVELVECLQSKRSLDEKAERLLFTPSLEKTLKKRISLLNKEIEVTSALVSSQQDIINEKTKTIELMSQEYENRSGSAFDNKHRITSILSTFENKFFKILETVERKTKISENKLNNLISSGSLKNVQSMKEEYIRIIKHLSRIEADYSNIAQYLTDYEQCSRDMEEMRGTIANKERMITALNWQIEEGLTHKIQENDTVSEQLSSMININEKLRNTIDERDKYITEQEEIIQSLEKQVENLSMHEIADPEDVKRLQDELRNVISLHENEKEEFIAYKLESARSVASKDLLIKELQKKIIGVENVYNQDKQNMLLLTQENELLKKSKEDFSNNFRRLEEQMQLKIKEDRLQSMRTVSQSIETIIERIFAQINDKVHIFLTKLDVLEGRKMQFASLVFRLRSAHKIALKGIEDKNLFIQQHIHTYEDLKVAYNSTIQKCEDRENTIISIKQNLAQVSDTSEFYKQKLHELQGIHKELSNLYEKTKEDNELLTNTLEEHKKLLFNATSKYDHLAAEHENLLKKVEEQSILTEEHTKVCSELRRMKNIDEDNLEKLKIQLESTQKQNETLQSKVNEQEKEMKLKEQSYREIEQKCMDQEKYVNGYYELKSAFEAEHKELENLKSTHEQLTELQSEQETALNSYKEDYSQLKESYDKSMEMLLDQEKHIKQLNEMASERQTNMENMREKIQTLKGTLSSKEKEVHKLQDKEREASRLTSVLETTSQSKDKYKSRLRTLLQELDRIKEGSGLESDFAFSIASEFRDKISALEDEIKVYIQQNSSLIEINEELENKLIELETETRALQRIKATAEALEINEQKLKTELKELKERLKDSESERNDSALTVKLLQDKLKKSQTEHAEELKAYSEYSPIKFQALNAEIAVLKDELASKLKLIDQKNSKINEQKRILGSNRAKMVSSSLRQPEKESDWSYSTRKTTSKAELLQWIDECEKTLKECSNEFHIADASGLLKSIQQLKLDKEKVQRDLNEYIATFSYLKNILNVQHENHQVVCSIVKSLKSNENILVQQGIKEFKTVFVKGSTDLENLVNEKANSINNKIQKIANKLVYVTGMSPDYDPLEALQCKLDLVETELKTKETLLTKVRGILGIGDDSMLILRVRQLTTGSKIPTVGKNKPTSTDKSGKNFRNS